MKLVVAILTVLLSAACTTSGTETLRYAGSAERLEGTPRVVDLAVQPTVIVADAVDLSAASADEAAQTAVQALTLLQSTAQRYALEVVGPPILVNKTVTATLWEFEMHLPIAQAPTTSTLEPAVSIGQAPTGLALTAEHHGAIENLHRSYAALEHGLPRGYEFESLTWEQYMTDPTSTPASENWVRIFRSVRRRR